MMTDRTNVDIRNGQKWAVWNAADLVKAAELGACLRTAEDREGGAKLSTWFLAWKIRWVSGTRNRRRAAGLGAG